jgi:hypothetical protein
MEEGCWKELGAALAAVARRPRGKAILEKYIALEDLKTSL